MQNIQKRKKGTVYPSGDSNIDFIRCMCINKILMFDDDIDYSKFDFLFGNLKNRPKRLIKYLISLDCLDDLEKIYEIIFHNK